MVLEQKYRSHKSIEQNRKSRNKPTTMWSINPPQRRKEYSIEKKTVSGGGARWRRSKRPGFRLLSGIQLDRDQTIQNTYKLNRRSKKRIAATL